MKIAIIRNLSLGDSVIFSAFILKLKELWYDDITIFSGTGLSFDYFSRLESIWIIKKVVRLDIKYNLLKKAMITLRYFKQFDLVIDTIQGSKLTSILSNIWWKKSLWFWEMGHYSHTYHLSAIDENSLILKKDFLLLQYFNIKNLNNKDFELFYPLFKSDFDSLKNKLKQFTDFDIDRAFIVIHPTPKHKNRELNPRDWNNVIDYVVSTWKQVVIIGTPHDETTISKIKDWKLIFKLHHIWLNIRETWAIIKKSSLYIGVNSWPMRISVALQKQSIVLNWPTRKDRIPDEKIYPFITNIKRKEKEIHCHDYIQEPMNCSFNEEGFSLCMSTITAEEIINEIGSHL